MTLQEMYTSYVEKTGKKFLKEANAGDKFKEGFDRFCAEARTKTLVSAQEAVEM